MIPATITAEEASHQRWFAIVVGAGIAGASLAASLADRGRRVLLIDKSSLPRPKTCGGTLNPRAVASLERLGLGSVLRSIAPNRITAVEWRQRSGATGVVPLAAGAVAVSREALDAALVTEAVRRGVEFLPDCRCLGSALGDGCRVVKVRPREGSEHAIAADVVLACDGLGSALAEGAGLATKAAAAAGDYIGTSIVTAPEALSGAPTDRILMVVGTVGYTGVVRVEHGRWNIAAAIRLDAMRGGRKPADLAMEMLNSVGVTVSTSIQPATGTISEWTVTQPRLSRQVTSPSAARLLLVGDASGYREPITGEGMAWALAGVECVAGLLGTGWSDAVESAWRRDWQRHVCGRQGMVRAAGLTARSPAATGALLTALRFAPQIGKWVGTALSRELPSTGSRR